MKTINQPQSPSRIEKAVITEDFDFGIQREELSPMASVNLHLWQPCNLRCKFCFAQFHDVKREMKLPKGHLPQEDHEAIIHKLAQAGTQKITFVGGEPTLCPWLPDLIKLAKSLGMTTMIVTNGTRLDEAYFHSLDHALDWVTMSIDSLDANTLKQIGRWNLQQLQHPEAFYREKINLIQTYRVRIKINTVVCRFNAKEDLSTFIEWAAPERWKIFQALPVLGQNDADFDDLSITPEQFQQYVTRQRVSARTSLVVEDNDAMTGSYVMIDPAGRFYDNVAGAHRYSSPILEKGLHNAFQEISFDQNQFLKRNGYWNWANA